MYQFDQKLTVEEIQTRFDHQVDRYSSLASGQQSAMDSRIMMERLASVAAKTTPHAGDVLDIGCGAGNYTLALLERLSTLNCTLLDLSAPMLERAKTRVLAATEGRVTTLHGDIRDIELEEARFDIVLTGTALHHLRQDHEWEQVFAKIFRSLKPHGSFWISDLVAHEHPEVQAHMQAIYGAYLVEQQDSAFRAAVFANIEREDTPRPMTYQLDLLRQVGFHNIDIVHKNACFAAFGGVK
jgi:tRNA (cmo5U34)-methyltransferase